LRVNITVSKKMILDDGRLNRTPLHLHVMRKKHPQFTLDRLEVSLPVISIFEKEDKFVI